jgi:hypothetical protein
VVPVSNGNHLKQKGTSYMYEPRYLAEKRSGVGGRPIDHDEPVIVIRAQDVLAPVMMLRYMELYEPFENADPGVLEECREHLAAIIEWQADNPERVKVADR